LHDWKFVLATYYVIARRKQLKETTTRDPNHVRRNLIIRLNTGILKQLKGNYNFGSKLTSLMLSTKRSGAT